MPEYSEAGLIELYDFFDNAPVGLHIVTPDGHVKYTNRTELNTLGYGGQPDAYVGHHIAEFHADDHVIEDMLNRLVGGQPLIRYGARLRRRDGEIVPVIIHSSPRMDGDDFVNTRCFTYVAPENALPLTGAEPAPPGAGLPDLDTLNQDEKEALFVELDDFFMNAPVALHIVTPDGLVKRANNAELLSMGYADAPEAYLGHHIAEFHAEAPVIEDMLTRLVGGQPLVHYHATLRRRDGSNYPVFIYSTPRMDGDAFINTRCFTFPLAAGTYDRAPNFTWPRNEDVSGGSNGANESDPRTVALRLMASRKRAEETLGFLAEVSKILVSDAAPEDQINETMGLLVPYLADWAAIDRVDPVSGSLSRVGSGQIKPLNTIAMRLESFLYAADGDAELSVPSTRRDGQTAVCLDVDAASGPRAAQLADLGLRSLVVVPVQYRGVVHGMVTLAAARLPHRRPYGAAEVALAEEFARRLAATLALYSGQLAPA